MLSEQSFPYLVPRRGASPTRLLVVPTRFLVVECPLPGFSSWSVPTWFLVVARPLPGSSSWRVPYPVPGRGVSPTWFLIVARPLPGSSSWRITLFYSFTALNPLSTYLSHWRILHETDLHSSCSLLGPSSQDGVWCMWSALLIGVGRLEGDKEGCIWREAQPVQAAPVWPLTYVRGQGGRGSRGTGGGVCAWLSQTSQPASEGSMRAARRLDPELACFPTLLCPVHWELDCLPQACLWGVVVLGSELQTHRPSSLPSGARSRNRPRVPWQDLAQIWPLGAYCKAAIAYVS